MQLMLSFTEEQSEQREALRARVRKVVLEANNSEEANEGVADVLRRVKKKLSRLARRAAAAEEDGGNAKKKARSELARKYLDDEAGEGSDSGDEEGEASGSD